MDAVFTSKESEIKSQAQDLKSRKFLERHDYMAFITKIWLFED